jgi:hypothetical protein
MIFTFGHGHECVCGRSLLNCYVKLEDSPAETARERMFRIWGPRWSHAYDSEDDAGVGRWSLTCIETNLSNPERCPCGVTPKGNGSGMRWFGENWGAPVCTVSARVAVPVGEHCVICDVRIHEGDQGFVPPHVTATGDVVGEIWHRACFLRALGLELRNV